MAQQQQDPHSARISAAQPPHQSDPAAPTPATRRAPSDWDPQVLLARHFPDRYSPPPPYQPLAPCDWVPAPGAHLCVPRPQLPGPAAARVQRLPGPAPLEPNPLSACDTPPAAQTAPQHPHLIAGALYSPLDPRHHGVTESAAAREGQRMSTAKAIAEEYAEAQRRGMLRAVVDRSRFPAFGSVEHAEWMKARERELFGEGWRGRKRDRGDWGEGGISVE